MRLRALRRQLERLRRAIDPTPPAPLAPIGPPKVIFYLPDNGSGPGDPGPGRTRVGDVELVIYPAGEPPAGEAG